MAPWIAVTREYGLILPELVGEFSTALSVPILNSFTGCGSSGPEAMVRYVAPINPIILRRVMEHSPMTRD